MHNACAYWNQQILYRNRPITFKSVVWFQSAWNFPAGKSMLHDHCVWEQCGDHDCNIVGNCLTAEWNLIWKTVTTASYIKIFFVVYHFISSLINILIEKKLVSIWEFYCLYMKHSSSVFVRSRLMRRMTASVWDLMCATFYLIFI